MIGIIVTCAILSMTAGGCSTDKFMAAMQRFEEHTTIVVDHLEDIEAQTGEGGELVELAKATKIAVIDVATTGAAVVEEFAKLDNLPDMIAKAGQIGGVIIPGPAGAIWETLAGLALLMMGRKPLAAGVKKAAAAIAK
jgi:hypothetical protein